jgi:hypothetical protein
VSISQPPAQGRGKSGAKSGAGPGRPPSANGGKGGQKPSGTDRAPAQRNNSAKTAGNRQVSAKSAAQRTAGGSQNRQRPGGGGRQGSPRGRGGPAPVQIPSRRPSPTVLGLGAIGVVIVIVLVIVLVGVNHSPGKQKITSLAPPSLVNAVTTVPESVFASVGLPAEITNYPKKVTGHHAPLTDPGLPEMLYEGAEYCPFCAAERWAMIMALSKFGTFSGLKTTFSSVSDFAPDTPTFSFYGSTYKSQYVAFKPYELATNEQAASSTACNVNGYACLETPPTAAYNLLESLGGGSFPFMDFGNKLVQAGAGFENQPLALAGLTAEQVAADLTNPSSPVAQAEDGSANYLTGAICAITGNMPADVCSAPYVKSAQKKEGVS